MIDLHSHTTASDGHDSPRELVELALKIGLEALAITDHDTVAGLAEAAQAAKGTALTFIPGIEIEVNFRPGEFHLLGLGLKNWDDMSPALEQIQESRKYRNDRIVEKMNALGIPGSLEDVKKFATDGTLGRPHFARYLIHMGKVKNIITAFQKYLGAGRPLYVPKEGMELAEAINLIHSCGGKAVVAHPSSLYLSPPRVKELAIQWKELGLDGIEAWHPGTMPNKGRRWELIAQELGLAVTAGSDYHGDGRPGRKLGRTTAGREIPAQFLENLFPQWKEQFSQV